MIELWEHGALVRYCRIPAGFRNATEFAAYYNCGKRIHTGFFAIAI